MPRPLRSTATAFALFCLISLPSGCADGALTRIDVSGSATTVVPAGTLLEQLAGDLGFEDFVTMNLLEAEELRNQGVEPGDITEARLTGFELEAIAPDGADLAFLDALTVGVSAPDLPAAVLASSENFPEGTPTVALDLAEVDLAPYIVSASMSLTTDVTARRPDEEVTVEARYVVEVGVTLQGAAGQL